MQIVVGPAASGKTTRLLEVAQSYLRQRQRVWWIALPSQRAYVYRRATQQGAVLGLEVLSSQQLYYRILAANLGLRPILTGPGRVALAGEALISEESPLPSPGEARLFARAIAEAKRSGVLPEALPTEGPEARRLQQAYARYEQIKQAWGRWDYDDFRNAVLDLLAQGQPLHLEADLLVVDGFRELSPLELQVLSGLSKQTAVWVGLPQAPEGWPVVQALPPRPVQLQRYRAPNPVSEARWVLRSIKRDLALGYSSLEVAVIAPEARIPALLTLADEYGLPLVDQTARTAAETPEGRLLLELLELPDYPTPSRLLAVPDLAPLGRAALEQGLVGNAAIQRLAVELGFGVVWAAWLARLKPPGEEGSAFVRRDPAIHPSLAWAAELLDSLPEVRHSPRRASLFERAKEAHRIASGPDFRHWWAALLRETYQPHRPPGGVSLLTPNLASGQRWRKLYLMYAVEGAYSTREGEDYFVPEELRLAPEQALRQAQQAPRFSGLSKRFQGRDRLLLDELKSRAEEGVITYPEASQEGPLEPEPGLLSAAAPPLPALPLASWLEASTGVGYRAPLSLTPLGQPSVEALRRYQECSLQFWATRLTYSPDPAGPWGQLIQALRQAEKLVPARLEALCQRFPEAEGWLRHHQGQLGQLSLGFRLESSGLEAQLDGVLRQGSEAHLYRFVAPATPAEEAQDQVRSRWSERWAAAHLLSAYAGRIQKVYLWAWPLLGEALLVYDKPIEKVWSALGRLQDQVTEAHSRFSAGIVEPNPGFRCRGCVVRDVCREGSVG